MYPMESFTFRFCKSLKYEIGELYGFYHSWSWTVDNNINVKFTPKHESSF